MDILTIISLPIHEYGLSFHLFIFFLISFISVLYCQYTSLSLQFIPKYFIVLDTLVNEIFNFPYLFNSISFCFIYVCIYIYIERERTSLVAQTVKRLYNAGDPGSSPGLGRSLGEGNGNPLQYDCLENPMDRGPWQATVYGVAKSRTRLSDTEREEEGERDRESVLAHTY